MFVFLKTVKFYDDSGAEDKYWKTVLSQRNSNHHNHLNICQIIIATTLVRSFLFQQLKLFDCLSTAEQAGAARSTQAYSTFSLLSCSFLQPCA